MTKRRIGKDKTNSPSHVRMTFRRQTHRKHPLNHIEYLPLTIEQDNNQPNGKKRTDSSIKSQSTMALHRKGENGSIFPILIDVPMKPQQPIQHLPCVLYSMPMTWSERINEKDGETVTKTQKRMPTTLTCGRSLPSEGSGLVSL